VRPQGEAPVRLTPPPAALVREDVLQGVRMRAEMVADALGLNGLAQLDVLMHAETADVVVVEAHAIPYLSPSSDLWQQVPHSPPVLGDSQEIRFHFLSTRFS
jgi:D-alanine-D-alanine ligase-like ATP-grasp enzyme